MFLSRNVNERTLYYFSPLPEFGFIDFDRRGKIIYKPAFRKLRAEKDRSYPGSKSLARQGSNKSSADTFTVSFV